MQSVAPATFVPPLSPPPHGWRASQRFSPGFSRISLKGTASVPALAISSKAGLVKELIPQSKRLQAFIGRPQQLFHKRRLHSASALCASALSTRCAAGQTQTVKHQSSTTTHAPTQGKQKTPMLDDGGTGLPPRGGGDGGGGGGGGGQSFSGGFWFFSFLIFLRILKDLEDDRSYRHRK